MSDWSDGDALLEEESQIADTFQARPPAPRVRRHEQRSEVREAYRRGRAPSGDAVSTEAPPESREATRAPVTFDPALLDALRAPDAFDEPMLEGLRQLLRRWSGYQSSKNVLLRIEDPEWLAAWDSALATTIGSRVLLRGSELGTFALQALTHGAARVLAVEQSPLDGRITSGLVEKNLLTKWHSLHGGAIQTWSEDERRRSFESFAHNVDVVPAESSELAAANCDYFVFPNIDHSLLGTGIVKALRSHRARGLAPHARVLPSRAKIFAMGIEWRYPSTQFQLQPMNRFRWSLYPQQLDLPPESWTARTKAVCVGEIEFESFAESTWDVELPVVADGNVDAIVYWFELDLVAAQICNAPHSPLRCVRPAVQYVDSMPVLAEGGALSLKVRVRDTRLHFETVPPPRQLRSQSLTSWYIPMLLDKNRNDAYRSALDRALGPIPGQVVLDIGAGCGLLSMMAAQAGAGRVVGCEVSGSISKAGNDIVRLNGLDDKVVILSKDCRALKVSEDLPERADLALFELFDCSLIGEGVLHFLDYARNHLLKPNARYLPMAAKIRAMVIECRLDRCWGLDVNLLNPYRFSSGFVNADAEHLKYRPLSEPMDVFTFDFSKATPTACENALEVATLRDGIAGAVLFWFDLQLDETHWISNSPDSDNPLHWKQGLQFLPDLRVNPTMRLPLVAKHDGSSLTFHWKHDAVPKEALGRLPLFDPRWRAAVLELERQTQGLLQHCAHNPDEYRKVAELAKRFAIDPAEHDIDPVIAQRFAATFFGS